MNIFKKISKWWKYWTAPLPDSICSDCGETMPSFGPGGPSHKCNQKKVIEKTVLEMKQKGRI